MGACFSDKEIVKKSKLQRSQTLNESRITIDLGEDEDIWRT